MEKMVNSTVFGVEKDYCFMNKALKLAQKAALCNEVPVGAVLVDQAGAIIATSYNQVEKRGSQTAHAEMRTIQNATKKKGNWRLDGCWLYVTLEPCSMCMGLVQLSRISGVVFAASSPLFGFRLDKKAYPVYKFGALTIVSGIKEQESATLLRNFFRKKREEKSG